MAPHRRNAMRLLAGSTLADLAFRAAQVALPLLALAETGSAWTTGLVGGMSGLPLATSPWWARRARQSLTHGSRLAQVHLLEAGAVALVPAAAAAGLLDALVLGTSGLLLGVGEALSRPGRQALLADIGDQTAPDRAMTLITWQDGLRRVGTLVGPSLGAWGVATGSAEVVLWTHALTLALAAALARGVRLPPGTPSGDGAPADSAPTIRTVVARRPVIRHGWVVRGTGAFAWFGFSLGLVLLGAQQGAGGLFIAVGMTAFGAGSLAGSVLAVSLAPRMPAVPTMCGSWVVTGAAFAGMGLLARPVAIGVLAVAAGLVLPAGIAAVTGAITRSTQGAERRAALSGQSVVVSSASSAGLLVGGPLIDVIGPAAAMVATGVLAVVVAVAVWAADAVRRSRHTVRRPSPARTSTRRTRSPQQARRRLSRRQPGSLR